jgi:hypothetical protein
MGSYATGMTETAFTGMRRDDPEDGPVIWSGYFSDAAKLNAGDRAST